MTESTIATREENASPEVVRESTREPERYSTPPVDIHESANGLTVVADLPGIPKENIDINVDNDVLTIKAVAPQAERRDASYREFEPASYWRQFRLGQKIDRRRIAASVANGVLKLELPFEEETKPRRIEVKVA